MFMLTHNIELLRGELPAALNNARRLDPQGKVRQEQDDNSITRATDYPATNLLDF
jgi:hypothetical protein